MPTCPPSWPQVMLGFLKARPTLKKEVPLRKQNINRYVLECQPVHLMFIDKLHRDQRPLQPIGRKGWASGSHLSLLPPADRFPQAQPRAGRLTHHNLIPASHLPLR